MRCAVYTRFRSCVCVGVYEIYVLIFWYDEEYLRDPSLTNKNRDTPKTPNAKNPFDKKKSLHRERAGRNYIGYKGVNDATPHPCSLSLSSHVHAYTQGIPVARANNPRVHVKVH